MSRTYGRNETLKNFASGLSQDAMQNSLAEFVAPRVVTGVASGQYKVFSDKNSFLAPDAARAIGGKAHRIGFESTDAYFNCAPSALEITIDEFERQAAGSDAGMLEEAKTKAVVTQAILSHEKAVFAAVNAALRAVDSRGNWSSSGYDPIAQIDEQIAAIANATGQMPNRMVLGLAAWQILRGNANVLERQPGAQLIGLTTAQLAAMTLNPNMEIRIGVLAYDANKSGKTASKGNIVGSECYIFVGSAAPTQYDPSFAKTFSAASGSVFDVRMYQDDPRTDVIAVDWTSDIKVVAAACGRRITVS
jgi:hypothetical protein